MFFILRKRDGTPGVFKVFFYHAEFEKKQIKMDCFIDKYVLFLEKMKTSYFYFCCNYGNKQHIMYWNLFESVYSDSI